MEKKYIIKKGGKKYYYLFKLFIWLSTFLICSLFCDPIDETISDSLIISEKVDVILFTSINILLELLDIEIPLKNF